MRKRKKPTEAEQNRLIIEHMDMAGIIAGKYRGQKGVPFDDLVSEGAAGLIRAARAWSPPGIFAAYASICIEHSISNFVRAWKNLEITELAEQSDNFNSERIYEWDIWSDAQFALAISEGFKTLAASPEEIIGSFQTARINMSLLENALKFLTKRERDVIFMRFFSDPPHTLETIARYYRIPFDRVVRGIKRTIAKLQEEIDNSLQKQSREAATPTAMRG